ncbi:centrosomal protein of 78 kDa-like isoform X2 [Cimex lectularius]|uniref:Centrosomal protein of 78 kDa n=1 Tax=Cimex lectularius TaxID=79782 RepID=A0A8I6R9J2_CIMLE|nr:centrosomal protein of 78 kDa-like isoform X2 [Cimex lectularius]
MPESVKSFTSSRPVSSRPVSSRSASTTSIRSNWSLCSNFSDKYECVCKAHHTEPLRDIKAYLSRNILSFIGDRIKYKDWIPLLKAIRGDKFLHFINIRSRLSSGCGNPQNLLCTNRPKLFILSFFLVMLDNINCEKKVRDFTKGPVIFTKYILIKLINALSECLSQSRALTCLQLQMLPLYGEPMQILSEALEQTKSLQYLSLPNCKIGDEYCDVLCRAVRNTTCLISLDLTNNCLSEKGATSIANLMKTQEIARYGECWKHSLRYRNVPNELIPGLRRITINDNPDIGDKGLNVMIDVLLDDFWIKAVDMQNCGITDWGCNLIQQLLCVDNEIVVFDVRRNPITDITIIANIVQTLAINSNDEDKANYGWIDIQSNTSLATNFGSSARNNKARSSSDLSTVRNKNGSQYSIRSSGSLMCSIPKQIPPKMTMIKKYQSQSPNPKVSPTLTMTDIMKNMEKYSSINIQNFAIRTKVPDKPQRNGPMKAISQSAVTTYMNNERNTNLPNSIRNKSLPQLCSRNSGRSRPQSSGDGLTKTLIKQRPLVQSRSTDCIKKTENPKNNTKTKNLNGIEKNPTNSNKPIVKECKKKLKRLQEESLSDKSEPNVFSNISNHSINFMHEKLKQKVLTKTVSKEKIRSVDMTLSLSSDESDLEFNFIERNRINNIQHTFHKFMKSQEHRSSDLDSSSEDETVNYFRRCLSNNKFKNGSGFTLE